MNTKLATAFSFVLLSPFEYGFNFGVTNLIQPYVACWINEVTIGNLTQTDCNSAANASNTQIQAQIQLVDQKWALVTSIWAIGGFLSCFLAGPASDYSAFMNLCHADRDFGQF